MFKNESKARPITMMQELLDNYPLHLEWQGGPVVYIMVRQGVDEGRRFHGHKT